MSRTQTLILAASAATASPDCAYDAAKLLALPFEQFDQDLTGGWRDLQNRGCMQAAAEILRRYRQERQPLSDGMRSLLVWHEGQLVAQMGNYQRAIPLLLAGVPVDDTSGFADYALGTVAFLRRDKPELLTARARLASLPKPANWAEHMTVSVGGKAVTFATPWPMNLNVLDGLIACFDQPYVQAYRCNSLKRRANAPAPRLTPAAAVPSLV